MMEWALIRDGDFVMLGEGLEPLEPSRKKKTPCAFRCGVIRDTNRVSLTLDIVNKKAERHHI